MTTNPEKIYHCPQCKTQSKRHSDRRQYCPNPDCSTKTFTPQELKRSEGGRPAIGDKPMTAYERQQKLREAKIRQFAKDQVAPWGR